MNKVKGKKTNRRVTRPRRNRRALGIAVGAIALVVIVGGLLLTGGSGGALRVPTGPDRHSLLVDPTNAQHLFYGNHNGLNESRDGGKSWQAVAGLEGQDAMGLALGSKGKLDIIHVAGHDVYFKSTDAGKTFNPVSTNLPGTDLHGFASAPSNPDVVYAFVVGHRIHRSEDGGQTWRAVTPKGSVDPGQSVMALAVDPKNPDIIFAGTMSEGYFRSADGGQTWEQGSIQAAITSFAFASASDSGAIYAAAPLKGLHRSDDGGKSWKVALSGPTALVATASSEPGRVYAVLQDESLKVSEDGGESWR